MITREQSTTLLDHPVLDSRGQRIGNAMHVFLDDRTGVPTWVGVKPGRFAGSETLVPLGEARMDHGHLEVPYSKQKVKDAPHVTVDARGHLDRDQERHLRDYYGGSMGAAAAPGTAAKERTGDRAAGAAGEAGKRGGLAGTTGATGTQGNGSRPAMTRSEERLSVGSEWRETGHARLHKHIVTEEVDRTVPVHHEHARLEREPITEANRSQAMSGPDLTEADYDLTLHAEHPVVETEVVPVERLRLTAEDIVENETVHARLRKEQIDTEGIDTPPNTGT